MEHIREIFTKCRLENRSSLVAYVTAGYPTVDETVDIVLAMEAGGAGEQQLPPFIHSRLHAVLPLTYCHHHELLEFISTNYPNFST